MGQRKLSDYEFYNTACILQAEVVGFTTSRMPKSWRYIYQVPMCNSAFEIVDEIAVGYAFYPNEEEWLLERKRHYTNAIAACDKLLQKIECLMAVKTSACLTAETEISDTIKLTRKQLQYVPLTELERLVRLCDKEKKLLIGARSHAKLLKK